MLDIDNTSLPLHHAYHSIECIRFLVNKWSIKTINDIYNSSLCLEIKFSSCSIFCMQKCLPVYLYLKLRAFDRYCAAKKSAPERSLELSGYLNTLVKIVDLFDITISICCPLKFLYGLRNMVSLGRKPERSMNRPAKKRVALQLLNLLVVTILPQSWELHHLPQTSWDILYVWYCSATIIRHITN